MVLTGMGLGWGVALCACCCPAPLAGAGVVVVIEVGGAAGGVREGGVDTGKPPCWTYGESVTPPADAHSIQVCVCMCVLCMCVLSVCVCRILNATTVQLCGKTKPQLMWPAQISPDQFRSGVCAVQTLQ